MLRRSPRPGSIVEALLLYAVTLALVAGALHLASRVISFSAARATWIAAAVLGALTCVWIGRYLRAIARTAKAWDQQRRR